MAVTNRARNRHLLMMLPVFLFLVFGYQNCAMDMAPTTPGAASVQCEPDAATLASFETVLNNTLNTTGTFASGATKCADCHGNATNPNGEGGYVIYQGNTTSDPTLVKRNFCAALDIGQTVVNHPLSPSHGGGQYPQSDIQDLVTFALANF